jgi:hypothetical protein
MEMSPNALAALMAKLGDSLGELAGRVDAVLMPALTQLGAGLSAVATQTTGALSSVLSPLAQLGAALSAAAGSLAGKVGGVLTPALAQLGAGLSAAATQAVGAVGSLTPALAQLGAGLSAATTQAAGALGSVGAVVKPALAQLGAGLSAATTQATSSLSSQSGALLSVANSLAGGLGDMSAKVLDVVVPGLGTLAETLIELPGKLLSAVTPFVEALNPALLLAFNLQMANLQATIGTAFENVFTILAPVLDQVASLIQSTMDALRPAVDAVTQMFGGFLVEVVRQFVSQMRVLLPLIEALVPVFSVFMTLQEMLMAPLRLLIEAVGLLLKIGLMPLTLAMQTLDKVLKPVLAFMDAMSALGGAIMDVIGQFYTTLFESLGLGDVLKSFARTVQDVTLMLFKAIVQFVNALPFGWGAKIIAEMEKRLGGISHAIAAPKDVGFKGIEQSTKDIAASAFVAGAGTKEDKQIDLMEQMRNYLRELVEQNKRAAEPDQKGTIAGNFMDAHPELTNTLGQWWLNVFGAPQSLGR